MPPTRGISCLSLVLYGISRDPRYLSLCHKDTAKDKKCPYKSFGCLELCLYGRREHSTTSELEVSYPTPGVSPPRPDRELGPPGAYGGCEEAPGCGAGRVSVLHSHDTPGRPGKQSELRSGGTALGQTAPGQVRLEASHWSTSLQTVF